VSGRHSAPRLPLRVRARSWWAGVGQPAWRRWARRLDVAALLGAPLLLAAGLLIALGLSGLGDRPAPSPTATVTGPAYRLYQPGLAWVPSGYQIKYGDQASATALRPYIDAIRSQVTAVTGVPLGVSATYGAGGLVDDHNIFLLVEYRPCSSDGRFVGAGAGTAGESCASPSVAGSTLTGGTVYLDSEYWNADGSPSGYGTGTAGLRNLVSHEVGHALGLSHPNASGVNSTAGDCVTGNDGGEKPVMCSGDGTVGGYQDDRAGEYVQQADVQGLRAMAAAGGAALPAQGAVKGIAGKCLDVDTPGNVDIANGRKVQIWDCNGMAQQSWILAPDGTWRVSGRCLDDYAAGSGDGNPIVLWACNGTAWQHWAPQPDRTVLNLSVNRYLDDRYAGTANGTPVWLWHWTGTVAQLWTMPATPAARSTR
jgi:hypothetical protein